MTRSNRMVLAVLLFSLAACGGNHPKAGGSGGSTVGDGSGGGGTGVDTSGTGTNPGTDAGTDAGSDAGTATEPSLLSLSLTPSADSGPVGVDVAFTATGIYSDGSEQDLTASVTWTSSVPGKATISTAGLLHPLAAGQTEVQAVSGAISATTTFDVTDAILNSIDVVPNSSTIALGTTATLQATGYYTDNTAVDLTDLVAWSSNSAAVEVSNGLAKGVSVGTATITATLDGISDTATVTVTAATLLSIAVAPAEVTLPAGLSQPLVVTGTFDDTSTQDLTAMATWTSSAGTIASVDSSGLLSALAPGNATVTATVIVEASTAIADVNVIVSDAFLKSITVTGPSTLPAGYKAQFIATGTYSDGSTFDVTKEATWSSSNTAVATVSTASPTQGLATGISAGTTNVQAMLSGFQASAGLTVSNAHLVSLAVTPQAFTITVGGTQQLTVLGTFNDGSTLDITRQCSWRSLPKRVAWVSRSGLVTGSSSGSATIHVHKGNLTDTATATVP